MMKNNILKLLIVLLVISFLVIGLVPNVNTFLRDNITNDQYILLIISIVFITFELIFHLKIKDGIAGAFNLMKAENSFTIYDKEMPYKEDKTFYYRDFPCDKDLFHIFWLAIQYKIIDNRSNLLNALLLKWCKEEKIKFIGNDKYVINSNINFDNEKEQELFNLIKDKSRNNFIKLTIFNTKIVLRKLDSILALETEYFRENGMLVQKDGKDIILGNIKPYLDQVYGFKNFLLNFSGIDEKTINEVHLWDEYLIYAELLDIAQQVKIELNKAHIDYSSVENNFKRVNTNIIGFTRVLLLMSYALYGIIFLLFTSVIWMIYIQLTWH